MTHSTHFIYGYMASDIWLRTIQIVRKETRCRHIGYSYRLTARVLLYAPSQGQDNTYHGLCCTSRGALAGTRNSSPVRNKTTIAHLRASLRSFNMSSLAFTSNNARWSSSSVLAACCLDSFRQSWYQMSLENISVTLQNILQISLTHIS